MLAVLLLFSVCILQSYATDPVPLPPFTCYNIGNRLLDDNAIVECNGPCMSSEFKGGADPPLWFLSSCARGKTLFSTVIPPGLESVFNVASDDGVVDVCKRMGFEGETKLTCTVDKELVVRAFTPDKFHYLLPILLLHIDSASACCCPDQPLCNSVPLTLPSPRIECYQSTMSDQSENSLHYVCPGNACVTSEIETIAAVKSSAQGCSSGPFRNLVPPLFQLLGPLFGFDIEDAIRTDVCGILRSRTTTRQRDFCYDNIEGILRFMSPSSVQPFVPVLVASLRSFRICCCGSSICNFLPTLTITGPIDFQSPTGNGNECYSNVKTIPPTADTSTVHCPGPCMTSQFVTNDPLKDQESSSQGCGSGVVPLANLVPPQALLFGDETVDDPCARLQFQGEGVVCQDSKKDIVKALFPPELLRKSDLLAEYLSGIDRMRVCCCVGDKCNGPLKPII